MEQTADAEQMAAGDQMVSQAPTEMSCFESCRPDDVTLTNTVLRRTDRILRAHTRRETHTRPQTPWPCNFEEYYQERAHQN